jgi:hypothetical protein
VPGQDLGTILAAGAEISFSQPHLAVAENAVKGVEKGGTMLYNKKNSL